LTEPQRETVEAAGVGHRITHDDDLDEPRELTPLERLLRLLKQGTAARGQGGVASAIWSQQQARRRPPAGREKDEPPPDNPCPSPCGSIVRGSEDTFVGREIRAAALVDHEPVDCDRHRDKPVATGSATVWVNNHPWARRMDETECGALIGEGEPTVWLPLLPTIDEKRDDGRPPRDAQSSGGAASARMGAALAGGSSVLPTGELARRPPKTSSWLPNGSNIGARIGGALSRGGLSFAALRKILFQ